MGEVRIGVIHAVDVTGKLFGFAAVAAVFLRLAKWNEFPRRLIVFAVAVSPVLGIAEPLQAFIAAESG